MAFQYDKVLEITGGSRQIAIQLLDKFAHLGSESVTRIQVLLDRASNSNSNSPDLLHELRQSVHSFKGSSSYVFAESLEHECIQMLLALDRNEDHSSILAQFNRIKHEFAKTRDAILKFT
jgi:hypothetical protein